MTPLKKTKGRSRVFLTPSGGLTQSGRFGGAQKKSVPRWWRRAPWERATVGLIALGLFMLMQPWSIELYGYSFVVLLAGVVGFSVAGKLPQG